jgi:hypothetical protein
VVDWAALKPAKAAMLRARVERMVIEGGVVEVGRTVDRQFDIL